MATLPKTSNTKIYKKTKKQNNSEHPSKTISKQNRSALLINLGSPQKPSVSATRRYLREFLMDKYVIDIPFILRAILVMGIIAPFRAFSSSKSYKKIWGKDMSPLLKNTQLLVDSVKKKCHFPITFAMRYSYPSITQGLKNALNNLPNQTPKAHGEIYCVPLYPHYAMSTTKTVEEKTAEVFSGIKKKQNQYKNITLRFKKPFYNDEKYIQALCKTIAPQAAKLGKKVGYDLLIFSYHGLPVRHLHKTDSSKVHCYNVEDCCNKHNPQVHSTCYKHQCYATSQSVVSKLKINPKYTLTTFQSRLGSDPWLQPYTDLVIKNLPKKGVKKLLICSPAFVSDNLETLFELNYENREFFIKAGGNKFDVIPCLNLSPIWVKALAGYINNGIS